VPLSFAQPQQAINAIQLLAFSVLGLTAGIVSWAFVRILAYMEDLFPSLPGNAYTQNILGMLMIGVLSYGFVLATGQPHTSGVGYATIQSIVSNGHFTLLLFVALLLGKLLATAISLGCGASGGVFSPSLFIGAALGKPGAHIIVTEEGRILGFVRFGSVPCKPADTATQTLRDIVSTEFVIAPETSILNTIVTRMNRRNRSFAIVVKPGGAVPRPDDVVGVIDSPEIAGSVIRNHYA
jgi:hypothetical protein